MKCMESHRDANFAKIVRTWQVENLIGKIMLLVESMGLTESQLEASKSLIKQFIWTEFNSSIYLTEEGEKANERELDKQGLSNLTQ